MPYVSGFDRDQLMCCSWDTFVDKESIARIIDAFVKHLDLEAYNPQTAVDSETHLIRDFQMTNQVTDHGLLESTMQEIKDSEPGKIVEVVADKGYEAREDMVSCLENGIIPHVITDDGKDGYEIEIPYEEAEADLANTDADELKKALHAGLIPEAYVECQCFENQSYKKSQPSGDSPKHFNMK